MKKLLFILIVGLPILFYSCSKTETDQEYPEIIMNQLGAFPVNCDTLFIGETFSFSALFTDNAALGSYSIEIHNNFDHHTHSTDIDACVFDPDKIPVNPFLTIQEFAIPVDLKQFDAKAEIAIPAGVDSGDYHFMIRLTDMEGWQSIKGISVKLLEREKTNSQGSNP